MALREAMILAGIIALVIVILNECFQCTSPSFSTHGTVRNQKELVALPNFAAYSAGARVIASSAAWQGAEPSKYFLGLVRVPPSTSIQNNLADTALQPWTDLGECWHLAGDNGFLRIHLAALTRVKGFTLEHLDATSHFNEHSAEAPRNFTVYGVTDENTKHSFGDYVYDNRDSSRQYFAVKKPSPSSFWIVELVINSNHGHHLYTCVYRLQVHGYLDRRECATCG